MFGFGAAKQKQAAAEAEQKKKLAEEGADPFATSEPLDSITPVRVGELRRRGFILHRDYHQFTQLPEPGKSIHYLMDRRHDLITLVAAVLVGSPSPCKHIRVATLSINGRNLNAITKLADNGIIGRVSLLISHYFSCTDRETFNKVRAEFKKRGWQVAVARTHAKVMTVDFGESKLVIETSANLRNSDNYEQCTVINEPTLYDFHAKWIDAAIVKYYAATDAIPENPDATTAEEPE